MTGQPCVAGVGAHGTVAGYVAGCRGPDCRRALTTYTTGRRRDRRSLLIERDGRPYALHDGRGRLLPHGSGSTYRNWLCRCEPCTAAHSDYYRNYKKGAAS